VLAQNLKVPLVRSQSDSLRKILESGIGIIAEQAQLSPVLKRLPDMRTQPDGLGEQRNGVFGLTFATQPQSLF